MTCRRRLLLAASEIEEAGDHPPEIRPPTPGTRVTPELPLLDLTMDSVPEKGTEVGQFFHKEENPFRELDDTKLPPSNEGEEELETDELQFKALKQDVLLQIFDSVVEDDDSTTIVSDLFAIGNRSGYFACGGMKELLFGETKLLHGAFENAKPKNTVTFQGGHKIVLPETPTHIRFTSDEKSILVALPTSGILLLDCDKLVQGKSKEESEKTVLSTRSLIDLIPNPSPLKANTIAYVTPTFTLSPYGKLYLHDITTQKTEEIDSKHDFTCVTFSHDGDILMAATRMGDILYYDLSNPSNLIPTRCPPPSDLPEPEGDSWWIIQGVHWIDANHQLVIYNPLSHPSDEPVHDYQAYIISNTSRLSTYSPYSFEFKKLPTPPVDAFGDAALRPWFWFQQLHDWPPGISDLVICSVIAGSDIGLLGRGNEADSQYRVWMIEDENRRATVPYNMEENRETIVMGMRLDYTGTKKLEKPLYPDEDPAECDPLPILWVYNNEGQLTGWNILYIPGIKSGKRALGMTSAEAVDQYWLTQRSEISKNTEHMTEEEKQERISWEQEWLKRFPKSKRQEQQPAATPEKIPQKVDTEPPTPVTPSLVKPAPAMSAAGTSQPVFGQPSQLGASSGFGVPSTLGAVTPGQSGSYTGFGAGLNTGRQTHVFGQGSTLGGFGSPATLGGGGFAKYTSSQSSQGGFLTESSQSGSFLSAPKTGSFLQGTSGQTGSFLDKSQGGGAFSKPLGDQGFAKFAAPSSGGFTPQTKPTNSGRFLESKLSTPTSSPFGAPSPFALPPKGPLSQRTQSLNPAQSSRSQSYDFLEDESESDSEESEVDETESEGDDSVRVDALNFGDSEFSLNLDGNKSAQPVGPSDFRTPIKEIPTEMPSVSKEVAPTSPKSPSDDFVKVNVPSVTPSLEKPKEPQSVQTMPQKEITPRAETVSKVEPSTKSQSSTVPPHQTPTLIKQTTEAIKPAVVKEAPTPKSAVPQPHPVIPATPVRPITPQKAVSVSEPVTRPISPARNKVELKQLVPVGTPSRIAPKMTESSDISQAFRLVVEQVTTDLVKLSVNTKHLAEYIEYQSERMGPKTADDLENPEEWTLADMDAISRIIDTHNKSIDESTKVIPQIDEAIQELEKSLKKMEAKKMEIDRFVRAVQDPEVRESLHSRKLAPDFARQQKDIRHTYQEAEEKLRDLASALTVLKAELADEKGSFGVQAPTTAGIYRVVNNVFSRLQILSAKIAALEHKAQSLRGVRLGSPAVESPRSTVAKASALPSTPVNRIGTMARKSPKSSPRSRASPGTRGTPVRKTMLDEKVDPWEAEEIIRDIEKKREVRKKIGSILKDRRCLSTQVTI